MFLPMKGNQGLDALAALCGGATQVRTEDAYLTQSLSNGTSNATKEVTNGPTSNSARGTQASAPGHSSHAPSAPLLPSPEGVQSQASFPHELAQQQWQQMMAAAVYGGMANPSFASMFQTAGGGMPNMGMPPNHNDAFNAMQQLAYYQYMQAIAAQTQAAQMASRDASIPQPQGPTMFADHNGTLGGHPFAGQSPPLPQQLDVSNRMSEQQPKQIVRQPQSQANPQAMSQVIPGPCPAPSTPQSSTCGNSMQPPPPPSQAASVPSAISTNGLGLSSPSPQQRPTTSVSAGTAGKIIPVKPPQASIARRPTADSPTPESGPVLDDKKQMKRAANRRSAQLSRKRKKLYIEELREENDELRRKEQILRSLPDLVVVFDSAGKLWFVSHSVSRFLDFTPRELEGSSFWERLCDESVRLLKAAFMDALAARKSEMDTAPLGSGVWELRLVDRDGSHKVITLNGVVHFSGEAPECVCSIRPRDEERLMTDANGRANNSVSSVRNVSVNSSSTNGGNESVSTASSLLKHLIRPAIQPQQSVISNGSGDDASIRVAQSSVVHAASQGAAVGKSFMRRIAQISDADSGSVISESGSDE